MYTAAIGWSGRWRWLGTKKPAQGGLRASLGLKAVLETEGVVHQVGLAGVVIPKVGEKIPFKTNGHVVCGVVIEAHADNWIRAGIASGCAESIGHSTEVNIPKCEPAFNEKISRLIDRQDGLGLKRKGGRFGRHAGAIDRAGQLPEIGVARFHGEIAMGLNAEIRFQGKISVIAAV